MSVGVCVSVCVGGVLIWKSRALITQLSNLINPLEFVD